MMENGKKFLEEASKNEALAKALAEAQAQAAKALGADANPDEVAAAASAAMLKTANANGYSLTAEDFAPSKMAAISEDELAAVAGGSGVAAAGVTSVCRCMSYGSGLT